MTLRTETKTPAKATGAPDETAETPAAPRINGRNASAVEGFRDGQVMTPVERQGFRRSREQDRLKAKAESDALVGSVSLDERTEQFDW